MQSVKPERPSNISLSRNAELMTQRTVSPPSEAVTSGLHGASAVQGIAAHTTNRSRGESRTLAQRVMILKRRFNQANYKYVATMYEALKSPPLPRHSFLSGLVTLSRRYRILLSLSVSPNLTIVSQQAITDMNFHSQSLLLLENPDEIGPS